jgi:acyl carrier protein
MHIDMNFSGTTTYHQASEDCIRTWLVEQITRTTGLPASQVDISQPFSSYGIDSVAAAGLSGELANWLGEPIAPTITWDYPTVKLLACHLASQLAGRWPLTA